ncbi:hypothetical protein, partial [Streptomyces shaanxiensis]
MPDAVCTEEEQDIAELTAAVEIDLPGEDDDVDAVAPGGTGDQQPLRNRRSLYVRHVSPHSRICPALVGGSMLRPPGPGWVTWAHPRTVRKAPDLARRAQGVPLR